MVLELQPERCKEFVATQRRLLDAPQTTPLQAIQWRHDYVHSYMRLLDFPLADAWQQSFVEHMLPAIQEFYPQSLQSKKSVGNLKSALRTGFNLVKHMMLQPEIFMRFKLFAYHNYYYVKDEQPFSEATRAYVRSSEFLDLMVPLDVLALDELEALELLIQGKGVVEFAEIFMEVSAVVEATFEYLKDDPADADEVLKVVCEDVIGGPTRRAYDGQSFSAFRAFCKDNFDGACRDMRENGAYYQSNMAFGPEGRDEKAETKEEKRPGVREVPPAIPLEERRLVPRQPGSPGQNPPPERQIVLRPSDILGSSVPIHVSSSQPSNALTRSSNALTSQVRKRTQYERLTGEQEPPPPQQQQQQPRPPTTFESSTRILGDVGRAMGQESALASVAQQAARFQQRTGQPIATQMIRTGQDFADVATTEEFLTKAVGLAMSAALSTGDPTTSVVAVGSAAALLLVKAASSVTTQTFALGLFRYLMTFLPGGPPTWTQHSTMEHTMNMIRAAQNEVALFPSYVDMFTTTSARLDTNFDQLMMIQSIQASHFYSMHADTQFLLFSGFSVALGLLRRFTPSHSMSRVAREIDSNSVARFGHSEDADIEALTAAFALTRISEEKREADIAPDSPLTPAAANSRAVQRTQPDRFAMVRQAALQRYAREIMKRSTLICLGGMAGLAYFTIAERLTFYSAMGDAHLPGVAFGTVMSSQTHVGVADMRAALPPGALILSEVLDSQPWNSWIPFFLRSAWDICHTEAPNLTVLGLTGSGLLGFIAARNAADITGIIASMNEISHLILTNAGSAMVLWAVLAYLAQQPQTLATLEAAMPEVKKQMAAMADEVRGPAQNFIAQYVLPHIGQRFVAAEFTIRLWDYVAGMASPHAFDFLRGSIYAFMGWQFNEFTAQVMSGPITHAVADLLPAELVDKYYGYSVWAYVRSLVGASPVSGLDSSLVKGSHNMLFTTTVRTPNSTDVPVNSRNIVSQPLTGSFWTSIAALGAVVQGASFAIFWVREQYRAMQAHNEGKKPDYGRTYRMIQAVKKAGAALGDIAMKYTYLGRTVRWSAAKWRTPTDTTLEEKKDEPSALPAPTPILALPTPPPRPIPQVTTRFVQDAAELLETLRGAEAAGHWGPYPRYERMVGLRDAFKVFVVTRLRVLRPRAEPVLDHNLDMIFELTYRLFVVFRSKIFPSQTTDTLPPRDAEEKDFAMHIQQAFSFANGSAAMRVQINAGLPLREFLTTETFYLNHLLACGVYVMCSIVDEADPDTPTLQYILECIQNVKAASERTESKQFMSIDPRRRNGTQYTDDEIRKPHITSAFKKLLKDLFPESAAEFPTDILRIAFRLFADYYEYVLDKPNGNARFMINVMDAFRKVKPKFMRVRVLTAVSDDEVKAYVTHVWDELERVLQAAVVAGGIKWLEQEGDIPVIWDGGTDRIIPNPSTTMIKAGKQFPVLHLYMVALCVRLILKLHEELRRPEGFSSAMQRDFVLQALQWEKDHNVSP